MLFTRNLYLDKISAGFKLTPIVVLIGSRQVGKTSIMKSFPTEKASLFLNGQDSEVAALFNKLSSIEQYLKIELNADLDGLLIIDEFQFIDGISTILKLLTDKHEKLQVLCSGSSSLDILQRVEESLAGRVRIIEVLSLSFAEYLMFKDEKLFKLQQSITDSNESALTANLQRHLDEYLIYGGFPRVALTDNPHEKAELLNDIYQTYLLRDVRSYIANEHFVGFNKLLRLLSMQIGNLVNINDLSRECGLSYKKCEEYICLLQQMYIIRMIEPYHSNKRKVIGKMTKVYFYDLGLRNMIYNSFGEISYRVDNGALFENYILLELWRKRRAAGTIQFYRTQNGTEVDFVIDQEGNKKAVECKYKRLQKTTSIGGLNSFCREENIAQAFVANISLQTEEKGIAFIAGIVADRI